MTRDNDAAWVKVRVHHQIVNGTLQSPGPGSNCPAVIFGVLFPIMSLDATLVGRVGVVVAIVEGGNGVTAFDRFLDLPDINPGDAAGLGSPVVHDTLAAFGHPVGGQ